MQLINIKQNKHLRQLIVLIVVFLFLTIIAVVPYSLFEKKYENKIYPNISIGEINLSGKNLSEAKKIINKKIKKIDKQGVRFNYQGKETIITPTMSSFEIDLAQQIINFDSQKTTEKLISFGRNKSVLSNFKNKINLFFNKKNAELEYSINEEEIKKIIKNNYSELESPAQDAKLIATSTPLINSGETKISINTEKEKLGILIDLDNAIKQLKNNLSKLNNATIELKTITDYPKIHQKDLLNTEVQARKILSNSPITLSYKDKSWEINKKDIAPWLTLSKKINNEIIVSLNDEEIKKYFQNKIAEKIEEDPIDARFEINNGRVTEFQSSRDGLELDNEKNILNIKNSLLSNVIKASSSIELAVKNIKSEINTSEINNLGIQEIIGTGHSNFIGSPANRIHNIKTGVASVNGLLLKPGDEFSLVSALGEVDADSGYLPELVIKGNKTIPEYGGGLCQVATTLFRTAIQSGLTITERRNHAYRVSYYEPAGTDAAVYIPHPDIKFLNDTKNYILIQSRIEGTNLYFDFWGTKDGREVEVSEPVIYNIQKPEPTKIIETLDLEPGIKKCTEHAHNGADAYFDYKVKLPDETEWKEKRFQSHYVPWQEVCLLGVEKLSTDKTETNSKKLSEESTNNDEENPTENTNSSSTTSSIIN